MGEEFIISSRDKQIISTTILLLNKILKSSFIQPAQIVSVGKLLHVFSKLPKDTNNVNVTLDLSGPTRIYEDRKIWHSWQINVEPEYISVSSGGHFHRQSTGGDSFTCMQWNASPGCDCAYNEYLDQLWIVDDAQPFDTEIDQLDLSKEGYSLDIDDEDNPLLGEEDDNVSEECDEEATNEDTEDENDGDWADSEPVTSTDPIEMSLDSISNLEEGYARKRFGYYSRSKCSICGCDMSDKKYFIDGKIKDVNGWALMCAICFDKHGEGIRWGTGQLYTHLLNGKWLLTAGFPPE
jgi:hypothetical protein